MGGALGWHTRSCPDKPYRMRRMNAEALLRCRTCYDLVWESRLREHAEAHGRPVGTMNEFDVRALFFESSLEERVARLEREMRESKGKGGR